MIKKIYKNELTEMLDNTELRLSEIVAKFNDDSIVNKGLFLMATAYFEATIRDVLHYILTRDSKKFGKSSVSISADDIDRFRNEKLIDVATDNHLFNLFKGNLKAEVYKIYEFITNKNNIQNESKKNFGELFELVTKLSDTSYYRNCLIHQSGKKSRDFDLNVEHYKTDSESLPYPKYLLEEFVTNYITFFGILKVEIIKNIHFYEYTRISYLKDLWSFCFSSPIMGFENYWVIDEERDLIIGIKYPDYESSLSSSEEVFLSIWRHQYNDSIPSKDFILCSIDNRKLMFLYEQLDHIKFYYMLQESSR